MAIAFVIPCKNEAPRIGQVLEPISLFETESKEPVRIIVVDDHSSDGLRKAVQRFGSLEVIPNDGHGVKATTLTGFRAALAGKPKPDIIIRLDADLTDITPRHITDLVSAAGKNGLAIGVMPRFLRGHIKAIRDLRIETSGQSAFNARMLEEILQDPKMVEILKHGPKYGYEILLYRLFEKKFGRPAFVTLTGAGYVRKIHKGMRFPRARNMKMLASQLWYRHKTRRL